MRLGISSGLIYDDAEKWAQAHSALGLKSVVFPLDCNADKSLVKDYVQAACEKDLVIAEVGVWRNVNSANPSEKEEMIKYAIRQLELAEEIGARCCVNVAGAIKGERWDGGYKENFSEEAWNKTVKSVQEIVDAVRPVKTKYALEPMPWMIPTGPDQYLKLLSDINRDNVGVHMDIVNMINCPERYFFQKDFMTDVFTKLDGLILSCHLKDIHKKEEYTWQLEECACGQGELNIEHYTRLATAHSSDMPMIIEHLHSDEEYRLSVEYLSKRLGL